MKTLLRTICPLLVIILISGCAGNPYILRGKQNTLDLNQDKGMVLFTIKVNNSSSYPLSLSSCSIREINQYKFYDRLKTIPIFFTQENYCAPDDIFLCGFILPKGRYVLTNFNGMLTSFFGYQYFLVCNKVLDVYPGRINYAGRLNFEIPSTPQTYATIINIKDAYDYDVPILKSDYLVLRDREIGKDLFY